MQPLTLLVAQKAYNLFVQEAALQKKLGLLASSCNVTIPILSASQVVLNSAPQDINDQNDQLTYPRICLYSLSLKNTQKEKFQSLSGSLTAVVDIWASGDLLNDVNRWIHFYVEAASGILRENVGDWGDGVMFPGIYEIQFQTPKTGGFGFLQMARITFTVVISLN